jgi:DNA methylase
MAELCPKLRKEKIREEMIAEMEAHEITAMFEDMSAEEYTTLKRSIELNGLQEAIWTFAGKIIDGRQRYRACVELGIEPQFREWDGKGSLTQFVVSLNLHRRHLTSSQKAAVSHKMLANFEAEAKERQRKAGGSRDILTASESDTLSQIIDEAKHPNDRKAAAILAEMTGTNRDYVATAKRIAATAPELIDEVAKGVVTIPEAKYLATLAKTKRKAIIENLASGKAKNAKEARRIVRDEEAKVVPEGYFESDDRYRLICKAVEDITGTDIVDESVDCVIVDPEYSRKALPVYESVAKCAARVLKPGGSLLVMTGHLYLPEILSLMAPYVRYHSISCYDMPGAKSQIHSHKVIGTWKPVLWFVKGKYEGKWCLDRFKSDRPSPEFHKWGQSLSGITDILERHTHPGGTVADFCLGGGTTAIAALKLNRKFIGSDIDERAINITKARIAEFLNQERSSTGIECESIPPFVDLGLAA